MKNPEDIQNNSYFVDKKSIKVWMGPPFQNEPRASCRLKTALVVSKQAKKMKIIEIIIEVTK